MANEDLAALNSSSRSWWYTTTTMGSCFYTTYVYHWAAPPTPFIGSVYRKGQHEVHCLLRLVTLNAVYVPYLRLVLNEDSGLFNPLAVNSSACFPSFLHARTCSPCHAEGKEAPHTYSLQSVVLKGLLLPSSGSIRSYRQSRLLTTSSSPGRGFSPCGGRASLRA